MQRMIHCKSCLHPPLPKIFCYFFILFFFIAHLYYFICTYTNTFHINTVFLNSFYLLYLNEILSDKKLFLIWHLNSKLIEILIETTTCKRENICNMFFLHFYYIKKSCEWRTKTDQKLLCPFDSWLTTVPRPKSQIIRTFRWVLTFVFLGSLKI